MSAGLPGIGLGGVFFLLSALFAPIGELVRTIRGQSSRERWARTIRQFSMAVAMLAAIQATLIALRLAAGVPMTVVAGLPVLSVALLGVVLGAVNLGALVIVVRARRRPRPKPRRGSGRWALLGSNQ